MGRILLAHNVDAGMEDISTEALVGLFRKRGWDPHICSTEPDMLDVALASPWDLIVAAGGDGSVGRVLLALPDRSVPVAILPLGGSNNIANALGIAGSPEAIVAALDRWQPVPFDIGIADGAWGCRCFVEATGFGLMTDTLRDIGGDPETPAEKCRIGRAAILQASREAQAADYHLRLDGSELRLSALLLEVLNIPSIGPRLPLAPAAQIGDGMLEVVLLPADRRDAFAHWLRDPEGGPPPLTSYRARQVEIFEAPDHCRLDDPKRGQSRKGQPVRLTLDREQARILVPGQWVESGS